MNPTEVEDRAARLPIHEIARELQDTLGQRPVAYLAGIRDAKLVGQWAREKVAPRALAQLRLREAFKAAVLIREAYGSDTARARLSAATRDSTTTRLPGC